MDQFTNLESESKIIRDKNMSTSEKILAIIGEDDDEDDEEDEKKKDDKKEDDQHFEIGLMDGDQIDLANTPESPMTPQVDERIGKYRKMLDCERQYMLDYASMPAVYQTESA